MSRTLYVYRPGHPDANERGFVTIASDEYVPESRTMVMTDLYMDGVATAEGQDIGSRRKRKEYMRQNNLADTDDFKNTWANARKARDGFYDIKHGNWDTTARREDLGRALYQVKNRGRR